MVVLWPASLRKPPCGIPGSLRPLRLGERGGVNSLDEFPLAMNRASLEAPTAETYRFERRQRDPLGLEEAALAASHDRHVATLPPYSEDYRMD